MVYLHPEQEYSLSDLAKLLNSSVRMIHYEATRLLKSGLLVDRRVGNVRLVRAETSSPLYRPLSDLLAVTFGPLPVLTELLSEIDGVSSAYIYGSWAARYHGEPGPIPADVDVIVVGTAKRADLDDCAQTAELRLRRPISIRRVSQTTWDESRSTSAFLVAVKSRPLITLTLESPKDHLVTLG